MNETQSISKWVATEFLANNPNHIYTFVCFCDKCESKQFVKIRTAQLPAVATKAGYSDMMTREQLDELAHKVIQAVK